MYNFSFLRQSKHFFLKSNGHKGILSGLRLSILMIETHHLSQIVVELMITFNYYIVHDKFKSYKHILKLSVN